MAPPVEDRDYITTILRLWGPIVLLLATVVAGAKNMHDVTRNTTDLATLKQDLAGHKEAPAHAVALERLNKLEAIRDDIASIRRSLGRVQLDMGLVCASMAKDVTQCFTSGRREP